MSSGKDGAAIEREELSRELHDGVGQWLSAASIYCKLLRDKLGSGGECEEELNAIEHLVGKAQDEVRFLSYSMAGAELREYGLASAIEALARRFQDLTNSIEVHSELRVEKECADEREEKVEFELYRVLQEFLTNALKYSDGERVDIYFERGPEGSFLRATDNGSGFDPSSVRNKGIGLRSMEERVRSIGGSFELRTALGNGVMIEVKVPEVKEE
jgi:signal transduction histidine kinase